MSDDKPEPTPDPNTATKNALVDEIESEMQKSNVDFIEASKRVVKTGRGAMLYEKDFFGD